jgi:photosystem II stability/assembly factor-like uncharacterized protein
MRKLIVYLLIAVIFQIHSFAQTGWSSINTGFYMGISSIFFVNENTGWVVGYGSNTTQKIWKSTNGGLNWTNQNATTLNTEDIESVYFIDINNGWAVGSENGSNAFVFKTTNGGQNWNKISVPSGYHRDIFFLNANTGFIAGKDVFKSTNAGLNWINVYSENNVYMKYMCFLDVNTGFVAGSNFNTYEGKIIKTTNNGTNWSILYTISENSYITDIQFFNNTTGLFTTTKTFRTSNSGVNWTIVNQSNIGFSACVARPSLKGWITLSSDSVLKTNDGGLNWISYPAGTSVFLNTIFFVNDFTGWIGGSVGTLLKTTTGGEPIGIQPISGEVPDKFILYQNYPNPFNPRTIINFDIPKRAIVSISIFNALGCEIETLVNEELIPGKYEISWNSADYSSGLYFYTLETGSFKQTKKMVLLK